MADCGLETPRLMLRPPIAQDLSWILGTLNTPAMMRHLGGKVRTEEQITEILEDDIAAFDSASGHRRWTIVRKDSGERIGRCGLSQVRTDAAPDPLRGQREIGWMIAEAHWGHGYATEAAGAVFDHAFRQLEMSVVYSQTSDSNAASTGVMRRLGLVRRPELDYVDPGYPPEDNPTTVWSIDAGEWTIRGG